MKSQSWARRVAAIAGAAGLGIGLALVAPVAANAATTNYTIDCDSVTADIGYHSQTFYVAPGNTVTFALTGFDEAYDYNTSTGTPLDPTGDSITLSAGDSYDFWDSTNTCTDYFDPYIQEAEPETVPSGGLLFTEDISISSPADQIDVVENDGGSGEHLLGGISTCGLSTEVSGAHVYGTLDITALKDGTYSFKGLYTTPGGYYVGIDPYDPIGDPFLAVYSNFDPANPDAGLVGCNDDLNDVGDEPDAVYRADGSIIEGHVPYFSAALAPGHYTLVLMTWEDLSSEDLDSGYAPWEEDTFAIGTKSTTFELWGPAGGLALGHVAFAALAATGIDLTYGVVGLAGTTLGMVLLGFSLRRRRTARG